MQRFVPLLLAGTLAQAEQSSSNPLAKVLQLVDELAAKITKDAEAEAKAYSEYVEWCDDTSKNAAFAIQTAETAKDKLEAKIGELSGQISASESQVDSLAASIATTSGELKDATAIRDKEAKDSAASDAELSDAIDTLSRAIGILSREMTKNPASFAQINRQNVDKLLQAFSSVLDAASFSSKDQTKLMALVQSQQSEQSDELDLNAPAAATYKTHSSGILDVLEDLKEKAEGQLSDLRKAETNNQHNFDMLKQSLEDQSSADNKDMQDAKATKSGAVEAKATAESDLKMTTKDLVSSKQQLATAHATCLQVSADHETTVVARKEELSALAEAKQILQETSSGAVSQTYSLLQIKSHSDLAGSEVVAVIKQLAKRQHSSAMAQLASRISVALRLGSSTADPFAKVKGLIQEMVARLEKEAGDEATEKTYCDEQLAKTEAKKGELEEDIAKMSSKIDRAAARSAQLKEDIQVLESELAALATQQAQMDTIRQEQHSDFETAKADLELGLSGVRQALVTLREYYGAVGAASMLEDEAKFGSLMQQPAAPELHSKAQGAGDSIIKILEVCESDFATNLAKEESEEADAQVEYEKISQENAVTRTTKEADIKYKTQEGKAQDKTASEYSADRETTNTQLGAVSDYLTKIKDRCVARPETYAARKASRAAEIQGLKEALSILEDEAALVQRKKRSSFRGALSM